MTIALFLLAALQADPAPAAKGLVIERTVRRTAVDTLGRRREIQRREVVRLRGADVSVTDLTFGERLVLRPGERKVRRVDALGGEYSELSFDEVEAARKRALDELRAARDRVAGTDAGKEIDAVLEGLDQFAAEPKVELKSEGDKRELIVNGDRVRLSAQVDPKIHAAGYFEALSAIEAFPPAVTAKLRELEGFPVKGKVRYVLFLDRVTEEFEVTSVKEGEVADSEFEVPEGLTRVPLAGLEPEPERKVVKPETLDGNFKEDDLDVKENPLKKDSP